MFFGTKETAFMKPSDCSDYLSNRFTHEISRKHKVQDSFLFYLSHSFLGI